MASRYAGHPYQRDQDNRRSDRQVRGRGSFTYEDRDTGGRDNDGNRQRDNREGANGNRDIGFRERGRDFKDRDGQRREDGGFGGRSYDNRRGGGPSFQNRRGRGSATHGPPRDRDRDTTYDYIIPRSNRYYEHDDRDDDGSGRRPRRGFFRGPDERSWGHDLFENDGKQKTGDRNRDRNDHESVGERDNDEASTRQRHRRDRDDHETAAERYNSDNIDEEKSSKVEIGVGEIGEIEVEEEHKDDDPYSP